MIEDCPKCDGPEFIDWECLDCGFAPFTGDCEHGYRAAGGTFWCPVCEAEQPEVA